MRKTGKISKKERKKLAAGNKKVSSWLRNVTREKQEERVEENSRRMEKEIIKDMDWQDTPDPEVELARKCRTKEADLKKERTDRYIVKNVVLEIMESIISISTANNIIDFLIERAGRSCCGRRSQMMTR